MIEYIKFTVDGIQYTLTNNEGVWQGIENAPNVSGNYSLIFEVSEDGIVTFVDSSSSLYNIYLQVIEEYEQLVDLFPYIPEFLREVDEIKALLDAENLVLDQFVTSLNRTLLDTFIVSASNDRILELENYIRIKSAGTLEQRKAYLTSLFQRTKRLDEARIKEITQTIASADCIVTFFSATQSLNPSPGYGLLRVQVLSPDNSRDYLYSDIERSLLALVPLHIKLAVIRYFAMWQDIRVNFLDWAAISGESSWSVIKEYIPPQ